VDVVTESQGSTENAGGGWMQGQVALLHNKLSNYEQKVAVTSMQLPRKLGR
jgi:hypothetical protein